MKKQELLNALEIVRPGLADKEIIEQSTSFAFMDSEVVTYNDEISIRHPVKGIDFEGAIKAEELYKLLSKLKDEEIEIKRSKSEILLETKRVSVGFTLQRHIKLPLEEIGELGTWKMLPDGFTEALKFCIFSCATDMSAPVFTCVNVRRDGTIESTDMLRATKYLQEEKMPVKTFLIPASSAQELVKYPVTSVAAGKGWIHFKTEEDTLFSCRIFEDTFPEEKSEIVFAIDNGEDVVFPKGIGEILDRASIFSKRQFTRDEEVQVNLKKNQIEIEAKGETGWIKENANTRYRGEPLTFSTNPILLKEIASQVRECIIGNNKIKFKGPNWEHVVSLYEIE